MRSLHGRFCRVDEDALVRPVAAEQGALAGKCERPALDERILAPADAAVGGALADPVALADMEICAVFAPVFQRHQEPCCHRQMIQLPPAPCGTPRRCTARTPSHERFVFGPLSAAGTMHPAYLQHSVSPGLVPLEYRESYSGRQGNPSRGVMQEVHSTRHVCPAGASGKLDPRRSAETQPEVSPLR